MAGVRRRGVAGAAAGRLSDGHSSSGRPRCTAGSSAATSPTRWRPNSSSISPCCEHDLVRRGVDPDEARRLAAAPVQQSRQHRGRMPEYRPGNGAHHAPYRVPAGIPRRCPLRRAAAAQGAGVRGHRRAHARARHRRHDGDLQRGGRRAAEALRLRQSRSRSVRQRILQGPGRQRLGGELSRLGRDVAQLLRPRGRGVPQLQPDDAGSAGAGPGRQGHRQFLPGARRGAVARARIHRRGRRARQRRASSSWARASGARTTAAIPA